MRNKNPQCPVCLVLLGSSDQCFNGCNAEVERRQLAKVSDKHALDLIAQHMSGSEWDADTCDYVAQVLRQTGRTIEEPGDDDGEA